MIYRMSIKKIDIRGARKIKITGKEIKYHNVFILFMIGCVLGVILEGLFCYFRQGHWESHVTFLWGPFNIVYGLGAVAIYLASVKMENKALSAKFFWFTVLGSAIEWLMGFIQDKVFNSYSWSYGKLAIGKYLSVPFMVAWGVLGLLFMKLFMPIINKGFERTTSKKWQSFSKVFTVFMCINLLLSAAVFTRWGQRVKKPEPSTRIGKFIDSVYPNEYLQSRFVEWKMNE